MLHLKRDLFSKLWTTQPTLSRTFYSVVTDNSSQGFEGDLFNS